MFRIFALASLVALSACVSSPAPEPTGPMTTVTASREILLKGLRGATNIAPAVVIRTYTLACGPSATGATNAMRSAQAASILAQVNGRVSTGGVSNRISESGDINRANPTLVSTLNCKAISAQTALKTNDPAAVMSYVVANGLLGEL